jgi:glycosyltransferase involved in cell wall biosynthesis
MKKNKITIVAYYFGPKLGAGVFMENLYPPLIKKLQDKGYIITLITNSFFLRDCASKLPQRITIHTPKCLEQTFLSKCYFLFLFGNTSYVRKAKYVLFSIDSIIGWRMNNTISIIHDLNEFAVKNKLGMFRTWFRKEMIKCTIKKAKKIIVISNFVKQQIKSYLPDYFAKKEITVIHSGIALTKKNGCVIPNDNREPFFMVVGRIDPKAKYLYETVKIFLIYQKKHPQFRLKIIGGISEFCRKDAEIFLKYIEQFENIDYLGYISDEKLDDLYGKATATFFLSKLEGFGFPVLEAFSRGCPVITNKQNEVNNEFSEGKDVKIDETEFENEDIIIKRINSSGKVDKNNLIEIASRFSWDTVADKYSTVLIN